MVVLSEKTGGVEVKPRIRWRMAPGLLLLLPLFTGRCPAADGLQADLIPLGLRARNEAPIRVEARLKWNGTRILEGRLEMEFREGNRVLGRYRTGDLALAGGEQDFRMLLPPILTPFSDAQVDVQMKFVTADSVIELDPATLFLPTAGERSLVLAWCDASTAGRSSSDIIQNLLFERFAPQPDDAYQRLSMTSVTRLAPDDLPSQPLAYTAFDVVALTPEAFREAGERQLQALARWVNGGGSVCVFVGGGLQPYHLAFLNQLAESASGGPAFLCDNAGNLLRAHNDILYAHSGLGRSVIVTGEDAAALSLDAAARLKTATFLWKIRNSQARAIADTGHWELPVDSPGPNYSQLRQGQNYRNARAYTEPLSYGIQPGALGAELMNRLMPQTVRLIPFSALIGLLVTFVLLIGPADYFGLGLLRRRRYTWILFPVTSIAFTVATVLMADHYLGLRDQRCSLTVVDLGPDGTALRWNRYELVFAARDKQAMTEIKDALWAPLEVHQWPGQFSPQYNPYNPNYGYGADVARETEPPLYEGVLPIHFQTSESIRQWRPELNRFLSFEPSPVSLPQNWRAVEEAWPDLQNVRAKLSANQRFSGDICAIFGTNSAGFDPGSRGILPLEMLQELCRGDGQGLLSVVSQVSPSGGGNFEDAQAMDATANDSALAIVTQTGDDIVVYRRFFYGN